MQKPYHRLNSLIINTLNRVAIGPVIGLHQDKPRTSARRTTLVRPHGTAVACCGAVLDFCRYCNAFKAMLNPKLLDEMAARVSSLLAATPAGDVEKNMRAALAGLFAKLDLVTREEFDVQREVLARTREKLETLETLVAELEAKGQPVQPNPAPK